MQKILTLPNFVVALLIIIAGSLMLNAAIGDSAIFDETAHIVAGYSYIKYFDYRFNPEHPPLVKMLAALPLAFLNLNFSTEKGYWGGLNEQWWAGNEFLYKSGNNADQIIFWARVGPIFLALILLAFTYYWSRELVGRWWALLPTALLGFSPIFLAHGHYVTTDVGAALSMLVAIYFFLKMLSSYSPKNLLCAGLAFGFAQAVKFSAALLIPYYFAIAILFYFVNRTYRQETKIYLYLWRTALAMAIGYLLVVYPLYFASTRGYPIEKQVLDTQANIQNFRVKPLADFNIWMAGNKILRPFGQYLLGLLMVLQRSAGGNNAFFLGMLASGGWCYYFPAAYLMKEPLPILILLLIALKISLWNMSAALNIGVRDAFRKFGEYLGVHFTEFALVSFALLYWLSSIASPLNIGVRHILPTIPIFYMLATSALRKWFAGRPTPIALTFREKIENYFHTFINFWTKTSILSLLIIWLIIETSLAAPYFLSYFNNFSGWQKNGFYYITDSNFDWGQDLKRLKVWVGENLNQEERIAVDYFGGGDPAYYLGKQFEPWWSARGNPKEEGIQWLAISANTLQGALAEPIRGFYRNPADEYRWLENPYQFTDRAGTSIFIYKLSD